jgi:hypothetical protein
MKRAIALTSAALCASVALAPASAGAQSADSWQFQGTLYGYLPTVSGKTTFPQSGGGSGVSIEPSTILDSLKFVFMGSLEGRKGQWGAYTDIIYMDLGNTKSDSRALAIGGVVPADATATVDFNLKGWVWTLGGTYRAVAKPDYAMDLLAGARMIDVTQNLDWQFGGNVGSIALPDRSGSARGEPAELGRDRRC